MAQHISILNTDEPEFWRIRRGVESALRRSYTGLAGSLRWTKLPADYLEPEDASAFWAVYRVPERIVAGGRACVEVHLKDNKTINNIYLVA